MNTTVLGIDLAKNIFQLYDLDASVTTTIRKKRIRAKHLEVMATLKPCLIGRSLWQFKLLG